MTIRELYREELSLRGIRRKDMIEAEEWADQRNIVGAAVMNKECPPKLEKLLRDALGRLADDVLAAITIRQ